jgi:hypothetical protein
MLLKDNVGIRGVFSIKSFNKEGVEIDEYKEDNLIMDNARVNMARLIAGLTVGGNVAKPINKIVLGTRGHMGTDILDYQQVGETDTSKPTNDRTFESTRIKLFSESIASQVNYRVPFDVTGDSDVTVTGTGKRYEQDTIVGSNEPYNIVRRVVNDRTVTYIFTIPAENANSGDTENPVVAYTEAALYADDDIFSMKTFPARVKEDTVKFEIVWSIIF